MIAPFRKSFTHALHKAEEWIFTNPKIVLSMILAVTLLFAMALPKLRIYSDFSDLLPQKHPYIETYNRIKENFGGANMIVMAIEVEQGTIFNDTTLKLIHEATLGIDSLPSVNHNLVSSLTHRTARKVYLSPEGSFVSQSYYDPLKPSHTVDELAQMQRDVVANPNLYGLMVSPDFKAALIKAQLNESGLDYEKTFAALQKVRASLAREGHKVHVTGNPVLTGWVYTYLGQIVEILAWTLALLATLLIVYFRRLYGIALPLLGIALSTIWGLGFMALAGINLEPLSLPIPFLIAARATSHGVQLVVRYYEELAIVKNGRKAARNALDALFRPGSLAIIVDAIGIAVLVLGAVQLQARHGGGFLGLLRHLHRAFHGAAGADRAAAAENDGERQSGRAQFPRQRDGAHRRHERWRARHPVRGPRLRGGRQRVRCARAAWRVGTGQPVAQPRPRLQQLDRGHQHTVSRFGGTACRGAYDGEGRHQAAGSDARDRALPGAHAVRPDTGRHACTARRGARGQSPHAQRRSALGADT